MMNKEMPSWICVGLFVFWFVAIIILKLMTSSADLSVDSNKFDLLLFQTSQAASQLKKQRKSAIGKLLCLDNDYDVKSEKIKKNEKIKEENLKASLEVQFDINSLDRNDEF